MTSMSNVTGVYRINTHIYLRPEDCWLTLKIRYDKLTKVWRLGVFWNRSLNRQSISDLKKTMCKYVLLLLNSANQMLLFKQDIQVTASSLSQSNLRTLWWSQFKAVFTTNREENKSSRFSRQVQVKR